MWFNELLNIILPLFIAHNYRAQPISVSTVGCLKDECIGQRTCGTVNFMYGSTMTRMNNIMDLRVGGFNKIFKNNQY